MAAVYIVAEAGVNHNGDRDMAFRLVDAAAEAGADCVKFQTFDAARLASKSAPKAAYQQRTTDAAENQLAMLKNLELPRAWHGELKARAASNGMAFMSTAFDVDSLDFLIELGVPQIKVPSGELTNAPLVWRYARARLPLIVSTGMATLSEVEQALAVITHAYNCDSEPASVEEIWRAWSRADWRAQLDERVTLLHCTSQYPAPLAEINLSAMDTLAAAFGLDVGYSDHSDGLLMPVAAVARGATLIEKHFTLDRTLAGPDHAASIEPCDLIRMVADIRAVEEALGDGAKVPQPSEWNTRIAARQQLIASRDIAPGAVIARDDLGTARCGHGLPPIALWSLVGTVSARGYAAGDVIEGQVGLG